MVTAVSTAAPAMAFAPILSSAPTLANFSMTPVTDGHALVSVRVTNMGANANGITGCTLRSTRPSVTARLTIFSPDSAHPDELYCGGDVSFGTAPYSPNVTVQVTNDKGLSALQANPATDGQAPAIIGSTIDGQSGAAATVTVGDNASLSVALSITDVAGSRNCVIISEGLQATVSQPVNHYDGCTFVVSQITASFVLHVTATDLLGQASHAYDITLTQQPKPVPVITNKHINYLASISSTGGQVVTGERVLPDRAQAQHITQMATWFWLGILLLLLAIAAAIVLFWRWRKLPLGLRLVIVIAPLVAGLACLSISIVTIKTIQPKAFANLTVSGRAAPQQKRVDDALVNGALRSAPGSVAPSGFQTSLSTAFKKAPEYALRNSQFLAPIITAQTTIDLKEQVGDSSGKPIWGTSANITSETEYIKQFQLTATGPPPGAVTIEVTQFPFSSAQCSKYGSLYSEALNATTSQTVFNLDFKKFLPVSYLADKKTGTLPYMVRVVKAGAKAGCNELVSPAVNALAIFSPEVAAPSYAADAKKMALFTTGTQPRDTGEIPNTNVKKFLDWTAPNQVYNFVMDSAPYPAYGRWQVSLAPFSDIQCLDPDLLIAYADVDLTSLNPGTKLVGIDFKQIAVNHPSGSGAVGKATVPLWQHLPLQALGKDLGNASQSAAEQQIQQLVAKAKGPLTYYVRFITLDANTGQCNSAFKPTNSVEISYGQAAPPGPGFPSYQTHYVTAPAQLSVDSLSYAPVRFQVDNFDPEGHYVYAHDFPPAPLTVFHAGQKLFVPEPGPAEEKSFLDSVGDFVSSIGDFISSIADVVSYVANAYNGIKSAVVDGVAGGLTALGVPCDSACKTAISAGISAGQMALGIPPSLPNVDQLMDQGTDYMAAEVADQVADASGVPLAGVATQQAAKAGVNQLDAQLKQAHAQADATAASPIVPDPDYLYQPARIIVTVRNTGSVPARGTMHVEFIDANSIPEADLTKRDLYKSVSVDVPTLAPGATLQIPISLEENYDAYRSHDHDYDPSVQCTGGSCGDIIDDPTYALAARKGRWLGVFNNAQVQLSASTGSVNKLPANFKPEDLGFDSKNWKYVGPYSGGKMWYDPIHNVNHVFKLQVSGGKSVHSTIAPNVSFSE